MNRKVMILFSVTFLASQVFGAVVHGQQLQAERNYPTVNKPVTIRLLGLAPEELAGISLLAEYRPNSETAYKRAVTGVGEPGVWLFTPKSAGLLLLTAIKEQDQQVQTLATLQLSVRFESVPQSGLVVMIFAGCVLFGGIIVSFRHAMKAKGIAPTT